MKKRPYSTYAVRAKLGLIVPTSNTVNEAEWRRVLPGIDDVSLHVTRMALHLDTSMLAGRQALEADIEKAVKDLAAAGLDVIAYGCTAGSMVSPLDSLTDLMQAHCGLPCAATASALVYAARALGLKRVVVATPYHDVLNYHEQQYLQSHGIAVDNILGLGIGEGGLHEYARIANVTTDELMAHAHRAWRSDADGMLISCTDLPTLAAVPRLEALFGRPVISSNVATLWRSLQLAGITQPVEGFGILLQRGATADS